MTNKITNIYYSKTNKYIIHNPEIDMHNIPLYNIDFFSYLYYINNIYYNYSTTFINKDKKNIKYNIFYTKNNNTIACNYEYRIYKIKLFDNNDIIIYLLQTFDTYINNNVNVLKIHPTKYKVIELNSSKKWKNNINKGHIILICNLKNKSSELVDLRFNKSWFINNNKEDEDKEIEYFNKMIEISKSHDIDNINLNDAKNLYFNGKIFNFSDIYHYCYNMSWYERKLNFIRDTIDDNKNSSDNMNEQKYLELFTNNLNYDDLFNKIKSKSNKLDISYYFKLSLQTNSI